MRTVYLIHVQHFVFLLINIKSILIELNVYEMGSFSPKHK